MDTHGVLANPVKPVMALAMLAENALNLIIEQQRQAKFPAIQGFKRFHSTQVRERYRDVQVGMRPDSGMLVFNVLCAGESRELLVFLDCDSDHLEVAPYTVSLSLGCWGQSTLYASKVLEAWSVLGPVWLDSNDSDAQGLVPLEEPDTRRATLAELLKAKVLSPYAFEKMVNEYAQERLGVDTSFEGFTGLSVAEYDEIRGISDSVVRWHQLRLACGK